MKKIKLVFILPFLIIQFQTFASPFITTWNPSNAGTSGATQIIIPGTGVGYTVDWVEIGDALHFGSSSKSGSATINFGASSGTGIYQVSISGGTFSAIEFNDGGDKLKLLTIEQWGVIPWSSMGNAFYGCSNLTYNATDAPDLSAVTNMVRMFTSCSNFNGDISTWDISNVTNTALMFYGATSFNQDISVWNVDNVTNMASMFQGASVFNQDLNNWNVDNVTSMSGMFNGAVLFNQNLNSWNVSNVTNMTTMFASATAFNGNITSWSIGNIPDISNMFHDAVAFNQDISGWNMSQVTNTAGMFRGASAFNQDLSNWNVSNVTNMFAMFLDASTFNQDLSNWDMSNVTDASFMFNNSALGTTNYDNTLIGWSALTLQNNTILGASSTNYCTSASQRQDIITNFGWTINDLGLDCTVSLPVEFMNLISNCKNDKIEITWQTATETNNDYFEIEKSIDGINWELISKVKGSSKSNETKSYSYVYQNVISQTMFRLKQVDFDNHFSYSKIISSNCNENKVLSPSIYPNPGKGDFTLQNTNSQQKIEVYNTLSGLIYENKASDLQTTLSFSNFVAGLYTVIVKDVNQSFSLKLIIIE